MLNFVVDFAGAAGANALVERIRTATLSVVALLLGQCAAFAAAGLAVREDLAATRDVFLSDYFLFSAQADVMSMTGGERIAFASLLDTCSETSAVDEAPRLRCELERLQYLIDYRQDRAVDRLLDAMQFMTSMIRYNMTIGRQNEAGLSVRQKTIERSLHDAIRAETESSPP